MTLALVLLLCLAGPAAAELWFPESLTTREARAEWLVKEAKKNLAAADAEAALPIAKRSRAKLVAIAQREEDLRALANKVPGGVRLHRAGAAEMIERLDAWKAQQDVIAADRRKLDQIEAKARAAEKVREDQRLAAIRSAGYPADTTAQIVGKKVAIGMTAEQALLAWGKPQRASERITAAGKTEVWTYAGAVLTFSNGRVVAIDREK